MEHRTTLSQIINKLNDKGYNNNLKIDQNGLLKNDNGKTFKAEDVIIKEVHRFEGISNPSDTAICYAIESKNGNKQGVLVNAYGAEASEKVSQFVKNVKIEKDE